MIMYLEMCSKLLRADGPKIMTQLINNIYEPGEWPKDFLAITITALKKKPKCSDHHRHSKDSSKDTKRRTEDVLGEDQFGFRRGKGTGAAVGMLIIISEVTVEIDEELCVCFIDWKKAFDRVKWTKLMQIVKETGTNKITIK
jgi:hypothetical protein